MTLRAKTPAHFLIAVILALSFFTAALYPVAVAHAETFPAGLSQQNVVPEAIPQLQALQGITVTSPITAGSAYISYTFHAVVAPTSITSPVLYTWYASDQSPVTHTSGISDSYSATWSSDGMKYVTAVAEYGGVTLTDTWPIYIFGAETPQLHISKSGPASISPGIPITYSLTITNSGNLTATNLVITDVIPAGANYISGGTLVGDVVSWTVSALPPNSVTWVYFAVTTTETITNWQYGVQADGDYSAAGETPVVTIINSTQPDLSITKQVVPAIASPGDVLTYTIIVANTGAVNADNVYVSDNLPSYVNGQNLSEIFNIAANTAVTLTLLATVDSTAPPGAVLTNTAYFSHATGFNTAHVTVVVSETEVAPTSVTITGPTSGTVNTGYAFNAAVTPISTTTPLSYTWFPTPNIGQGSDTVIYSWATTGPQTIFVTASNSTGVVTGSRVITIADLNAPDLSITKSGPATANSGTPITYTLTITNGGSMTATNLVITDVLPTGASYVSGGTLVGNVVSWTVGGFISATQVNFVVTATETITNWQYGVQAGGGYSAAGDTSVVTVISQSAQVVPVSGVVITGPTSGEMFAPHTFTAYVSPISATPPISYSWQASNQLGVMSNSVADSTSFAWGDSGPQVVEVTAYNAAGVATYTHYITIETPIYNSFNLTLTNLQKSNSSSSRYVITNTETCCTVNTQHNFYNTSDQFITSISGILGSGSSAAYNLADISALPDGFQGYVTVQAAQPITGAVLAMPQAPALYITKNGPATANPGDQITYTLTVTNVGTLTATNLLITDTIPTGANYVGGGTKVGNVIRWSLPDLGPYSTAQVSFVVTAAATIVNQEYGVSADDGYSATGTAPVTTEIVEVTDGTLAGQVKTAGGSPLANITVAALQNVGGWWQWVEQTKTNANGEYQFTLLAGTYRLGFFDWSYNQYPTLYYSSAAGVEGATDVQLVAGATQPGLDMIMPAPGNISGQVEDPSGNPLPDISVSVYRRGQNGWNQVGWARTDTNGQYTVGKLAAGSDYRVGFFDWRRNRQYAPRYYQNAANPGQATPVSVAAGQTTANVDVTMTDGGHITGLVTGAAGESLANINVVAYQYDGLNWRWVTSARTNAQGRYDLARLSAGTYRVEFRNGSDWLYYSNASAVDNATDVVVQEGQVTPNINIALRTSQITGAVTDDSGTPLEDIRVIAHKLRDNQWWIWATQTRTDANGHYELTGLNGGSYRVEFVDDTDSHADEFYNDAADIDSAVDVSLFSGQTRSNIDAVLDAPAPPLAEVSTNGMVQVNSKNGQVTIQQSQTPGRRSDITISRVVTCAVGSPTQVQLMMGATVYPMQNASGDNYSATIPANHIAGEAELTVSKTCGNEPPETVKIGEIQLYDPSGNITDADTGDQVVGAVVTLYKVPGWRAKTGPDDDADDTCQSNLSKNEDNEWSQTAPTELGELVLAGSGEISPTINPQITGSDGRYAWDVAEGCWYVVVEANSYETLTSSVVGVPPPVTDLDLTLTAITSKGETLYLPVVVKE